MPTPAFMTVEGAKQGLITTGTFTEASVGNIYVEGHEDEVLVQAFNHWISVPRDLQSGQPSGQRVHGSLIIAKVFDKCSPRLYQALTTGERLIKVKIKWYRTSSSGTREYHR